MIIFSIVKNIPHLKPVEIMSLNGAICCFFYVYHIPIGIYNYLFF